jgi:predicted small lipoprotein YifL
MNAALKILLCAFVVFALAACGNKGPLVMPASAVPDDQPRLVDEPLDDDEWVEDDWDDDDRSRAP